MMRREYMNRQRHKKVIISGGGTGGHIFPAISIANALRTADREIEILFVGALGRMEMEKVPAAGYAIIGLPVAGLRRKRIWENFSVIIKLIKSVFLARKIIRDFRPDVVVGVGGYASGPVLWIAGSRNIPVLIQEQNSYAGVTNRLLAKKAACICVAYKNMEKFFPEGKIMLTGNPVRSSYDNLDSLRSEGKAYFGIESDETIILVLGGSLGAGSINNAVEVSALQFRNHKLVWIWQSGKNYFERVTETVRTESLENIRVRSFIERMDLAYAAADIIVSRAGAGTISELCLVGKPVILVPSPNVAEDHQTKNALALVEGDAAIMLSDSEVAKSLPEVAEKLAGDKELQALLSMNIKKLALPGSAKVIATQIIKMAER
jgi:UDP-N-acetylglucosamine--N-acetylmuramyl-(pentapeptide) pyrophosphoryl-undecaprenol N-acetylglucosamine transferase